MGAVATIGLWGCAGEIGRIALQVPVPTPIPGPPGSPRLAVRPLQDMREPGPDEGTGEPFNPPRIPIPAELILEGELQTFYVERSTLSSPFFSLMVAPLGLPLAALSGLKILPTPITPILPVNYRANLTIQVRLRDSRTGAVIWERTVEEISELSEAAGADFFKGKDALMKEVASQALQAGIQRLARQVPSSEWFMARWPKRRPSVPAPPAAEPR
ncbi:MAG: hypothetical protein HYW08_00575 [candidate division NC10 bacterium]|nr:hypothetical protein [candidate division NC10 bacterium]